MTVSTETETTEPVTEEVTNAEIAKAAARAAKVGSGEMADKIGKMLRQAENERELGNTQMADNIMERVTKMSEAYAISLDYARSTYLKREKVETPEERQYVVGSRKRGRVSSSNDHLADLFLEIAQAHDARSTIGHGRVHVWTTTFPSTHEMIERLFALLSVQMVSEADAALKAGKNKERKYVPVTRREEIPEDERLWGEDVNPDDWADQKRYANDPGEVGLEDGYWSAHSDRYVYYTLKAPPTHRDVPVLDSHGEQVFAWRDVSTVDGRVWRKEFYNGFIARTGERIRRARAEALKAEGIDIEDASDERGLVLVDKKQEVDDHFEKVVLADMIEANGGKPLGSYMGAKVTQVDHAARAHGTAKANEARLGDEKDLGEAER